MGKAADAAGAGGGLFGGAGDVSGAAADAFGGGGLGSDLTGGLLSGDGGGGFDMFGNPTGGMSGGFFGGPGDLSFGGTGGMGSNLYDQASTSDLGGQNAGNIGDQSTTNTGVPTGGGPGTMGPTVANTAQPDTSLNDYLSQILPVQGPSGLGGTAGIQSQTMPGTSIGGGTSTAVESGLPGAATPYGGVGSSAIPGVPQMASAAPVPYAMQSNVGNVPGSFASPSQFGPTPGTGVGASADVEPQFSSAAPAAAAPTASAAAPVAPAQAAAEAAPAAQASQAAANVTAQNAPAAQQQGGGGGAAQIGNILQELGLPSAAISAIGEIFTLLSGHENPIQFLQHMIGMLRGGGMQQGGQQFAGPPEQRGYPGMQRGQALQVGQVINGWRYNGGDPRDQNSWTYVGSNDGNGAQAPQWALNPNLTTALNE